VAVPVTTRLAGRSSAAGGRFRGNYAPDVVVVLTGPVAGCVTCTVGVATGVGATVGVGITGGAESTCRRTVVVGAVGAMVEGTMLVGAMTGPDGAVTPCAPSSSGGPSSSPSSFSDSSLSGWVRGEMGQRCRALRGYCRSSSERYSSASSAIAKHAEI
jgi:hypothetical protein